MKKLALLTMHQVPNYGSALQAFATQYILEKLGYKCVVLQYKFPNQWHYNHGLPKPSWKSKIGSILPISQTNRRVRKLKDFLKNNLHFSKEYNSLQELKNEDWSSNYDMVIVGSDQVWSTKHNKGDTAFVLSFLPDEMKRISIASSFACNAIESQFKSYFYENLLKFSAISVREQNGKEIINDLFNEKKQAEVILDPTLLLNKNDWLSLLPKNMPHPNNGKKYILVYGLYYAFTTDPRAYIYELVRFYKDKFKCDVILIEGVCRWCNDCGFDYINAKDSSIVDFINLFSNASLVITTSFHGTAFALNFSRPVISVVPEEGDDRASSLLKRVNKSKFAISVGSSYEHLEIGEENSGNNDDDKLEELRRFSIAWIVNALN